MGKLPQPRCSEECLAQLTLFLSCSLDQYYQRNGSEGGPLDFTKVPTITKVTVSHEVVYFLYPKISE